MSKWAKVIILVILTFVLFGVILYANKQTDEDYQRTNQMFEETHVQLTLDAIGR